MAERPVRAFHSPLGRGREAMARGKRMGTGTRPPRPDTALMRRPRRLLPICIDLSLSGSMQTSNTALGRATAQQKKSPAEAGRSRKDGGGRCRPLPFDRLRRASALDGDAGALDDVGILGLP